MNNNLKFYIDGAWVDPIEARPFDVINPATEKPAGQISLGSAADVDRAVKAARVAFPTYSRTSKAERIDLLKRIVDAYKARYDDVAKAISREMGAPAWLATKAQAAVGVAHLSQMVAVLKDYEFEQLQGRTLIIREPIGVCGFITPWNWPINQIVCKVAPALAAGCTMVLKPSEIAPFNAIIFAEALHAAGVPKGVFNLVNGDGPTVGQAIAAHPGVDLVSFTGSTRAGILVAKAAADTVKRVHQELGGKSANIVLPDADLKKAVREGVQSCFRNSGQSCNAPTRMFVHVDQHDDAVAIARETAESVVVGDPEAKDTTIGPVVSEAQFNKIQRLIEAGVREGATLVTGGPGRPEGLDRGYYVKPTVFANVRPDMTIAREEIFGPVLSIMPYQSEAQVVELANDTVYGLAGYVQSSDLAHARRVAAELRAGQINLNGAPGDMGAPFGGYKQSGNGREWGKFGFEEFLEIKAVLGYEPA
ncbi:MAG TPA: aldehyde dehydrogenase family protein [Candidatus Methylomirabilis sp.]|nr:aldehyde dehydrogenase family protein [Candidatus Methylomirabilis sp.]